MGYRKNLIGQRVGRLLVISFAGNFGKTQRSKWMCRCDCGNEKAVTSKHLVSGRTVSCGCWKTESTLARFTRHGHSPMGASSGTYGSWQGMKDRCYNSKNKCYPRYGGRGIRVCDYWLADFKNFLSEMGEKPEGLTLDRINVNGHYEKSNCKWSTPKEQCRNKRRTIFVEFNGSALPLIAAAESVGVRYQTALQRFKRGWPIERVLENKSYA